MIARLLDGVEAAGGTVRSPAPAERLAVADGRVVGVVAAGTTHAAEAVVDCTGVAAAGSLLAPHGLRLAQRHSPGLLIVAEAAPVTLDRVVHAPGVYLRPDGNGRLLIGSAGIDAGLADSAGRADARAVGRPVPEPFGLGTGRSSPPGRRRDRVDAAVLASDAGRRPERGRPGGGAAGLLRGADAQRRNARPGPQPTRRRRDRDRPAGGGPWRPSGRNGC